MPMCNIYKNTCVDMFTLDMVIYREEVKVNCFQNGTEGSTGNQNSKTVLNLFL